MFKIGDKVRYIGSTTTVWNRWLYKKAGIIIELGGSLHHVKYQEKLNNKYNWWLPSVSLNKVIPEYILDWEKKLDA